MFSLEPLPYKYDSLTPYIDKATMEIHHKKHHQAYIDKLNAALESHKDFRKMGAEELIMRLDSLPEQIRVAVRNNGGGHLNHSFFWKLLKKDVAPGDKAKAAIEERFGTVDNFKRAFFDAATGIFGSGWAWLVLDRGNLEIITTPNQDSPLMSGRIPIIGLDVWEHAYYLKYKNKRADYVEAFFHVINWNVVEENLANARKRRV